MPPIQPRRIGITCYPTYGGSGVVATELGIELAARVATRSTSSPPPQPFRLTGREQQHPLPPSRGLPLPPLRARRPTISPSPPAWPRSPSSTPSTSSTSTTPSPHSVCALPRPPDARRPRPSTSPSSPPSTAPTSPSSARTAAISPSPASASTQSDGVTSHLLPSPRPHPRSLRHRPARSRLSATS